MNPLISVVIPAYNEENYLTPCLKALKEQEYPKEKFEVIVVDNGSGDKTSEIAKNFGVRLIVYSQEKSAAAARQKGISESNGEIIAFTDADTVVSSDWLSQIEFLFSDQKIVAVGGLVLPKEKSFVTSFLFGFYDFFLRLNQLCGVVLPWGNNLVIRKNILYEVGGFNKTLSTSEDWELAIRIKRKIGRKSKVIYNTNLVVYTSTRKHQNKGVFLKYVVEGIDNYFNVVILGRAKTSQMRNVR